MDYKHQNDYTLIDNITPNIIEIIKVSLKLAKKMIFYLPRNSSLEEFFEILYQVYVKEGIEQKFIFADVQMLNSANKIKALLIIIGDEANEKVNNL